MSDNTNVPKGESTKANSPQTWALVPPASKIINAEYIADILRNIPPGVSPAICSKPGDPDKGGWIAAPVADVKNQCPAQNNNYLNCSTFKFGPDNSFDAKKTSVASLHLLLCDDVGSKVPLDRLSRLAPTSMVETSPNNFQAIYVLDPPIADLATITAVQAAVSEAKLGDPGAFGASRWTRLPGGINGKKKYGGDDGEPFRCNLAHYQPENRYTLKEFVTAFDLKIGGGQASTKAIREGSAPTSTVPGDAVYTPKPTENAVIPALKSQGLYKREISLRKHDVTCPWVHEHTDELDTGAAYFEQSDQYPMGGFCCQHSHGDQYSIRHLLERLGINPQEARNKALIRLTAGELNRVIAGCELSLVAEGGYYQAGGRIVTISKDPSTGDVLIVTTSEAALTTALGAIVDFEKFDNRSSRWVRSDPPPRHVSLLSKADSYAHLPPLNGLARQPYFRETDGELVIRPGYDPVSKMFGEFDPADYQLPEPTEEAAHAALGRIRHLLREFRFSTAVDEATAIAAIFTAVVRPVLVIAPGFHTRAPAMSSGKSTLNAVIGQFAGPGPNLTLSYPPYKDEALKMFLSVMKTAPAVMDFDDMSHDWIDHGVVKQVFTNSKITGRLLGGNETATTSTRTLILGSGNNVGPQGDLLRRVLVVNLNAKTESAVSIQYEGDPLETLRANRSEYVSDVLTVILAWQRAGKSRAPVPNLASYGKQWAEFARHPLTWLGLPDPAAGLFEQIKHDPDADNLSYLLSAWHTMFGSAPTTIRKVMEKVDDAGDCDLRDALLEMPFVERDEVNRSKMGGYLKRHANRIVDGLELQKAASTERNAWRVMPVAEEAPPLPPLPASAPPIAENDDTDSNQSGFDEP